MVKCPRCGYENPSTAVYCDNCAYLLADDDGKRINNPKRDSNWNMGLGKKIAIVLGIIVIAFLLFTFVYNNTQPSTQDSLNVVTDDGTYNQSSSYPYKLVINYPGSWYAEYGDPNYLVKESGSGKKIVTLDCAAWERVAIDVQKQDYDTSKLKVQLLKNGAVVAEESTKNVTGRIVINYNY
ncbi:MAG: zinc-ribbon domain-containing protein [Methanobrevibacter thaueri]|nr:zinc-ribbon domain-containing protein [Methanobrevibacter thaueri]